MSAHKEEDASMTVAAAAVTDALAKDTVRRERSGAEVPLHPNLCGPCEDCTEFLGSIEPGRNDESAFWDIIGLGHPDPIAMRKHAERFGRGGMEPWGMGEKRTRRRARPLADEVAGLLDRGLVPSAVADALGISDRRARSIIAKLRRTRKATPQH